LAFENDMSNHCAGLVGRWALAGGTMLALVPSFGAAQQRQALDASGGVTVVG
jgi:hypothetical protein